MGVNGLRRSRLAPWGALVLGAIAELLHQQFLSDVLRFDCRLGHGGTGLITGALALGLVAIGSWLSWHSLRVADDRDPRLLNRRFIAKVGLMLAGLLAVGIVWQVIASFTVPPCPPR